MCTYIYIHTETDMNKPNMKITILYIYRYLDIGIYPIGYAHTHILTDTCIYTTYKDRWRACVIRVSSHLLNLSFSQSDSSHSTGILSYVHTYIVLSFAGSLVENPDRMETQVMENVEHQFIDVPVLHSSGQSRQNMSYFAKSSIIRQSPCRRIRVMMARSL